MSTPSIYKSALSEKIRKKAFGYLQLICMIIALWSIGSASFASDDFDFGPAFATQRSVILMQAPAEAQAHATGARYGVRTQAGAERAKSFGGGAASVEVAVTDGSAHRCRASLRDLCRNIENAEFQFNPAAKLLPASSDLKPKSLRISKDKVVVHYTFR